MQLVGVINGDIYGKDVENEKEDYGSSRDINGG